MSDRPPAEAGGRPAGRRFARLYAGALLVEAAVVALLWALERAFGR